MLTVCCVWVKGPVKYTADYVVRLHRMACKFVPKPFIFACLTDRPEDVSLPGIVPIHIDHMWGDVPPNGAGYWAKVRLFSEEDTRNRDGAFSGRVLYIDLDSLIVSNLSPIVDYPAPFAITADALVEERKHLNTDRYGRTLVRAFNSSVMVWDAGFGRDIYETWTPEVAQRLSTDQDFIAELYPNATAMPYSWFPRISRQQPPWPDEAKVVLVKKPKPHEAVERWPWFEQAWGGWD